MTTCYDGYVPVGSTTLLPWQLGGLAAGGYMVERHNVSVIDTERCGIDIVLIRFTRPEGYVSLPGQWFRLTLPTVEAEQTKTFTDAVGRRDDWLELATRLSGSPFKNALATLVPGDEVAVQGPGGRITISDDADKVAFLVGGVGVTPARSVLRDAQQRGHIYEDAVVFYGSRDPSCAPYLDELQDMSRNGVRVVPVYERPDEGWPGERGLITADIVRRGVDPSDGRPVFVAGPPAMVAAMNKVLDELRIAEDRRRIEWFGARQK